MKKLKKINKKEAFKQSAVLSLGVSAFSAAFTVTGIVFKNTNSAMIGLLAFAITWPVTLAMTAGLAALKYLENFNPLGSMASGLMKGLNPEQEEEEE